jgi:hypothetical protein
MFLHSSFFIIFVMLLCLSFREGETIMKHVVVRLSYGMGVCSITVDAYLGMGLDFIGGYDVNLHALYDEGVIKLCVLE